MKKAATYCRMSKDETGDGLGIERQQHAIRAFVEQRGWTLDTDWQIAETASASVKKQRPGFERLLRGIHDGEVTLLVAYAQDRLARRLHDTARLVEAVEQSGCEVTTVTGGFDLSSGYGRGLAGIMGSVAAMEVQVMSERRKARAAQNARNGKVTNGGSRPFGYDKRRRRLVPDEAALLREAYERLAAGGGVSSITKDWNRRGIPTAAGSRWTTKILRGTLSRPALCGRVVHRGVLVRDGDGNPIQGQWETVFTPEEYDRLEVLLAARKRMDERWTSERRHLLTGLLRCGRCGGKMVGFRQTSGVTAYVCRDFRHLSRDEAHVDAYVTAEVKARSDELVLPVRWRTVEAADVAAEIGELEHRKHGTIQQLVNGHISADTLTAVMAGFDARLAELRERQIREVLLPPGDGVILALGDHFDRQPLEQRRAGILAYTSRVIVHPSKTRGKGFNPDLIEIVYRPAEQIRFRVDVELPDGYDQDPQGYWDSLPRFSVFATTAASRFPAASRHE